MSLSEFSLSLMMAICAMFDLVPDASYICALDIGLSTSPKAKEINVPDIPIVDIRLGILFAHVPSL